MKQNKFLLLLLLLLTSCGSQREIEHVWHHDTVYSNSVVHDSVDRWHTHYEYLRGDTLHVVDTFWRDRWHVAHDTAYKTVVDVQEREVEKVVEKRVTVWWPVWVAIGLVVGFVAFILIGFEVMCNKMEKKEENI